MQAPARPGALTAQGGCLCGNVRYAVRGEPSRIGLCHSADCRKESGSAFVFFGVWPRAAFSADGKTSVYEGRSFCPECGARLFCLRAEEVEIRMGSLDPAPTGFAPSYENWTKRREDWLAPQPGFQQFDEDPPETESL